MDIRSVARILGRLGGLARARKLSAARRREIASQGGRSKALNRKAGRSPAPAYEQPYRAYWLSLTPRERLRRAWRLRNRVPNLRRLHDAKLLRPT